MKKALETLGRAFALLWTALDQTRRFAVNAVFLVLLILLVGLFLADTRPQVEEGSALVVAPTGMLVEQLYSSPVEEAMLELLDQERPETLMRTLLEAIEEATDDDRIEVMYLDLDKMQGGSLSKLQTLTTALEEFKAAGKTIIASAEYYGQPQYHLAAVADEVFLHPMGMVFLTGYGSYRRYYRDALDMFEVDWNVFRVGEYKSAVEPFLRNDMSPEAKQARLAWLNELWVAYRQDVAEARGLETTAIEDYVQNVHTLLADHDGQAAELAKATGLVDEVAHRDQVRDRLIELVGEDEETKSFRQIDYRSYLEAVEKRQEGMDEAVAVVVAKGTILGGSQPAGRIGGKSTARLIRQAREDEKVKALVLRVDSPGGSSFASEVIRREVELTREAGKPVIASFGSVAASGGYWISMPADEIWAHPTSITGSIGIFAMVPTFQRTLAKLGVHNDGVGTSNLAGTLRPDRELPAEAALALQEMIDWGYRDFITKAAAGRHMTVEEVDRIARGRVWTGRDALRLGLVDHLGGLEEAIAAGAVRAGLGEDYEIVYFEKEPSSTDRLLSQFLGWLGARAGLRLDLGQKGLSLVTLLEPLAGPDDGLQFTDDPKGLFAYCFCEPN
ncbi:MAG: signal peptide peptidase SppA [Thermoanaerobaculia bacterium]